MNNSQLSTITKLIESLDEPSASIALAIYAKLIKVDKKGEISQLSRLFSASFTQTHIPKDLKLFNTLGVANFLIWMAYSLYDGVIDGDSEVGDCMVGNILERKALELYRNTKLDWNIVLSLLEKTDQANSWEVHNCRFSKKSRYIKLNHLPSIKEFHNMLASRSIAHVTGPVLLFDTYSKNKQQKNSLFKSLADYCIARQINDDLHDWVEDFNNGRITIVVCHLLKSIGYKENTSAIKAEVLQKMKKVFYDSELDVLCSLLEKYVLSAINGLIACGLPKNSKFTLLFLQPILESSKQAREIHESNKLFVNSYSFTLD